MAWCMLGYDKNRQWTLEAYPYKYVFKWKWGLCKARFARELINPYFKSYKWYSGPDFPGDVIYGTDFTKNVIIILTSTTTHKFGILHYIIIIGKLSSSDAYIVTDQS